MIENVEKYIDFLEEHDINSHEFLFCYLVASGNYKDIKRHFADRKQLLKPHQIDKLISSNILIIKNYNKDEQLKLGNVTVSSSFTKKILINHEEAAQEIWDAYFDYGMWDGNRIAARNIMFDDFVEIYSKIIKNNKQEHERILRITKAYVKSRTYAEKGLKLYIGTRMYNTIENELLPIMNNNIKKYGENRL